MPRLFAQLSNIPLGNNYPVAVMGVINLDPQSFYQASYFGTPQQAVTAAEKMIDDGVDIIDIGGVSTAPGSSVISAEEEIRRVQTVIKQIAQNWDFPISIDTHRAKVAQIALSNGATIVNDVYGLKFDSAMATIIKDTGASCVLMATESRPGDQSTLSEIISSLQASLRIAQNNEIPHNKIVIDPGVGFGKPVNCDLDILRNLEALRVLNQPILLGVSRKHFIGQVLGYEIPSDRLYGTLAVSTFAILKGVNILRTHDVRATKDCIRIVAALQSSLESE